MYDRETKTLWSHLTGEALAGPLKGETLEMVSSVPRIAWKDWRAQYPETKVLSIGSNEDLVQDVYDGYHHSQRTGLFEPETVDRRFGLKDVVIGVRLDEAEKAYPLNKVFWKGKGESGGRLVQDTRADIPVLIYHDPRSYFTAVYDLRDAVGSTHEFSEPPQGKLAIDTDGDSWNLLTGEGPGNTVLRSLPHVNIYWFAWVDFYPKTEIYKEKPEN